MALIRVNADAKMEQMKPAKFAFISKQGEGTNIYRAMKNAVDNLSKDSRLKGKRAKNLSPVQITFTLIEDDGAE